MTTTAGDTFGAIARVPSHLARHDLTPRGAILSSVVVLGIITALDLIDGTIGLPFTVGYLLIVATAPLAVQARGLYTLVLMPPVLLVAALSVIAWLAPEALVVPDLPESAGAMKHAVSATAQLGGVLLLGQGLAITAVLLRIWSAQNPRGWRFYSQG